MMVSKKPRKQEIEDLPEFIIIDDQARVFSGLMAGYPVFSEDINKAKPLKYQESFEHMKRYHYGKIEQMFLENGREKRKHSKTKISL